MCGLFRIPVKELFKYSERLTETGYELQHFKSCFHILWRCSLTVQRAKRLAWAHSEIFTTHFWLYFDQKRPIFKWNGPSSFILCRESPRKRPHKYTQCRIPSKPKKISHDVWEFTMYLPKEAWSCLGRARFTNCFGISLYFLSKNVMVLKKCTGIPHKKWAKKVAIQKLHQDFK